MYFWRCYPGFKSGYVEVHVFFFFWWRWTASSITGGTLIKHCSLVEWPAVCLYDSLSDPGDWPAVCVCSHARMHVLVHVWSVLRNPKLLFECAGASVPFEPLVTTTSTLYFFRVGSLKGRVTVHIFARLQASSAGYFRSLLFWDLTQHW